MRHRYKQLHRVEVPHDGPTCKADCLNWVVAGDPAVRVRSGHRVRGRRHARQRGRAASRRIEVLQLPVAAQGHDPVAGRVARTQWFELVAGTYMDEFAEWHAKDLVVRESLAGSVPSAGVGTCFSRRAMLALIEETQSQPFNTESLTEDYDVGARIGKLGMQSIFPRFPVQFATRRKLLVRPRSRARNHRDDAAMRARVLPRYLSHRVPATRAMDARHRPARLEADRLERLAGQPLSAVARPQGRGHGVRRHARVCARAAVSAVRRGVVLRPDAELFPSPFIDSTWMQALLVANFVCAGRCA